MPMSNAAIYARVSSARQKEQETIRSQTVALHTHAEQLGLDVPEQWVFEDDGHSGASLVRPALERLRDLVCQVPVDVLLVYSPDRPARKYAYQALLIEEFAKAGTTVVFVKGPRSDSPEDALLVQFQGMIAEYERAQILERTRRGKAHRAKSGTINVLSGAPFGYRYVRKSEHAEARYEIVAHEAAIVAELFARYADGGVAIGELARWLSGLGVATRTGKPRWDRSTVWGMLRNPAYAGLACFGKTMRTDQTAGLNRTARLAGRATPRSYTVIDRARSDWLEIPVPALVAEDTWQRVQRRLEDNKRYAARNSRNPSLLQGICACSSCGYAYYRTSTRTTNKKIYYYYYYYYYPLPRLGRLPLRARPGLRQQAGARRLPRHRRLEPHHRPACRPGPDPKRDQQAAPAGPHRGPRHRRAPASRCRTGQGHHGDHPAHRRLPGGVDLPRRAPDPHARAARPPDQPAPPDRRARQPTRRPGGLPQARRQPRRLPHRAARQGRHSDRRRAPARPAPARQRRSRRRRKDHYPPLHPGAAQREQRDRRQPRNRLGGRNTA